MILSADTAGVRRLCNGSGRVSIRVAHCVRSLSIVWLLKALAVGGGGLAVVAAEHLVKIAVVLEADLLGNFVAVLIAV